MNYLSEFYAKHPEYRRLRVARRSPTSIHFELEPGVYEAHFQVKPIYERVAAGLWLPAGPLATVGRMAVQLARNPRAAMQMVAGLPFAAVLTLQPDAAAGKDVQIGSSTPTQNFGASTFVGFGYFAALDYAYGLFQFALTSIPAGSTVSTSVLTLVRFAAFGSQAYTYGAYKILRAWTEGTKTGSAPADGATFNTYDGVNNWGTAGCNNTTTDRSGSAENGHAINYAGNNTWAIPLMTQAWVNSAATNYGLWLGMVDAWSAQGLWRCCSSDHATAGNRPSLTVTYTLPAGGAPFNPPASPAFRGPFG